MSVSLEMVAVEVLRRLKSNDGRVRLVVGVGLKPIAPLQVADAGNRGGGISPCFGGCGAGSSAFWAIFLACAVCEGWEAALEDARRQPLKLSFRLNEELEDGVSGSVEVDVCVESDVSFFCRARGALDDIVCSSTSLLLYLYSPLGRG